MKQIVGFIVLMCSFYFGMVNIFIVPKATDMHSVQEILTYATISAFVVSLVLLIPRREK